MAPVGIFLYQRWDDIPIGIFTSEEQAKSAADDGENGEYVLVPIEANQPYDDLIDETLPGAIIYRSQGLEARVATLETDQQATSDLLDATRSQAQTKFTQVDGRLDDLEARVTALEGG